VNICRHLTHLDHDGLWLKSTRLIGKQQSWTEPVSVINPLAFRGMWVIIVSTPRVVPKMLTLTLDTHTMLTASATTAVSDQTTNAPKTAWPMLTTLTHDLRQPLSIIEACADYLDLILPAEDLRAREQITVVRRQVADANRILGEALVKTHYGTAPVPR